MLDPQQDELWDVLVVTDLDEVLHESPGTVKLSGHARKIAWDVKDPSGSDGGSSELKNAGPIQKFEAAFTLADDPEGSDFALWDEFEEVLRSSYNSKPPKALTISHPDLARNGYFAACVESIGECDKSDDGMGVIKIGFIEHRPPKPRGGAGAAPKDKPDDPDHETEQDKKIKDRLKKIDELQEEWTEL